MTSVSLDRSIPYVCDKVLFDGSGSNFQSEIQQVWKFLSSPYVLWQGRQIVGIDVSLDSLLKKKYKNITEVLITSDRITRLPLLMSQNIGPLITFVASCLIMILDVIFIVKLNTRPHRKDENFT